jgi:hypothetical protein
MRRAFHLTVLLERFAIFGPEEINGHQDTPRVGIPCGEGGDGRQKSADQLHTCWMGSRSRKSEVSWSWEMEDCVRTHGQWLCVCRLRF